MLECITVRTTYYRCTLLTNTSVQLPSRIHLFLFSPCCDFTRRFGSFEAIISPDCSIPLLSLSLPISPCHPFPPSPELQSFPHLLHIPNDMLTFPARRRSQFISNAEVLKCYRGFYLGGQHDINKCSLQALDLAWSFCNLSKMLWLLLATPFSLPSTAILHHSSKFSNFANEQLQNACSGMCVWVSVHPSFKLAPPPTPILPPWMWKMRRTLIFAPPLLPAPILPFPSIYSSSWLHLGLNFTLCLPLRYEI